MTDAFKLCTSIGPYSTLCELPRDHEEDHMGHDGTGSEHIWPKEATNGA